MKIITILPEEEMPKELRKQIKRSERKGKRIDKKEIQSDGEFYQHKSYDKMDEETRYDDLYMAFSGKWIYIRFNPDKYKDKLGFNQNPMLHTRLTELEKEIGKQIKRIENGENEELVERIYMYYDEPPSIIYI